MKQISTHFFNSLQLKPLLIDFNYFLQYVKSAYDGTNKICSVYITRNLKLHYLNLFVKHLL